MTGAGKNGRDFSLAYLFRSRKTQKPYFMRRECTRQKGLAMRATVDTENIQTQTKTAEGAVLSRSKPAHLNSVKHFAKVSRSVVLRSMAPDQCLSARIFWALILWSWCGPEKTEDGMVVLKDVNGYLKRDNKGRPIPARQRDIFQLLELRPNQRANISHAIERFIKGGRLWTDERGVMYTDPEPPPFAGKSDVSTDIKSWVIADRVIRIEDLPDEDSDARTASIRCLEQLSTAWKNDLKSIRTGHRMRLVQAISDGRIIIDKKRREVKEEAPSSSAFSTGSSSEPIEPKKAEEEDGFATFKNLYPKAHLDEGKAKPVFLALTTVAKRSCIERLQIYLDCERWKADGGQWIPLASNWLKSYEAEPPPPIVKKTAGKSGGDADYWERRAREATAR